MPNRTRRSLKVQSKMAVSLRRGGQINSPFRHWRSWWGEQTLIWQCQRRGKKAIQSRGWSEIYFALLHKKWVENCLSVTTNNQRRLPWKMMKLAYVLHNMEFPNRIRNWHFGTSDSTGRMSIMPVKKSPAVLACVLPWHSQKFQTRIPLQSPKAFRDMVQPWEI